MVHIQFFPEKLSGDGQTYCYRVAEQSFSTDLPIPDLVYLKQTCNGDETLAGLLNVSHVPDENKEIYNGTGWIGNRWREVLCHSLPTGYLLKIEGIAAFSISEGGNSIVCSKKDPDASVELLIEAAIGPALILTLAINGTFCFHASAILVGDRVLAFLGESGKGKSTLASWLDNNEKEGWRRIADDILPVAMGVDGLQSLPHYPQLKIAAKEQPSLGMPDRLPVAAVYIVRRPRDGEDVSIQVLGAQESVLALARHTVASRLFDAALLTRHLDFCIQVAKHAEVRELIYPFNRGALQDVHEVLLENIHSLPNSAMVTTQGHS